MRWLLVWLLAGMAAASAAVPSAQLSALEERPAGSPGTATPHPFKPPLPRHLPSPAPNSPPLLRPVQPGSQPDGNLAPPDGELPLLEQQRQRNRQNPGKRAD